MWNAALKVAGSFDALTFKVFGHRRGAQERENYSANDGGFKCR